MQAEFVGLDSVMEKLRAKALSNAKLSQAMRKSCLMVAEHARLNMSPVSPSEPYTPPAVVTGLLRSSITHRIEGDGSEMIGYVGTFANVEYAKGLEFGHSKVLPRPFMYPALAANHDAIVNEFKNAIKEAIE